MTQPDEPKRDDDDRGALSFAALSGLQDCYTEYVAEFPQLVSYSRFIQCIHAFRWSCVPPSVTVAGAVAALGSSLRVRPNMKPTALATFDKFLLRKQAIVESIYDQLKNISQIEHTRHHSLSDFMFNVLGGLIA